MKILLATEILILIIINELLTIFYQLGYLRRLVNFVSHYIRNKIWVYSRFSLAKKCHFRVVWVKSKKNGKLASVKYLTNMSVQEMAKGEPFWSVTASTNSAPDHQREGQFAQLPCQACHKEEEAARCTSPLVNCHDQPCLLVPSLMSRVTTGINDAKFLVKVCTQHNI